MNSITKLALVLRGFIMFVVCCALGLSISVSTDMWWGFRVAIAFALAFAWDRVVFRTFIWQEDGSLGEFDD